MSTIDQTASIIEVFGNQRLTHTRLFRFDGTLNKIEPNDFFDDGIIHLDSEVRVLQSETNAFAYEQ
jgi:hypothetical protein